VVRESGEVIFDHAPPLGAIVTAGFLFDVPVPLPGRRLLRQDR
jgi:hypothetical protein